MLTNGGWRNQTIATTTAVVVGTPATVVMLSSTPATVRAVPGTDGTVLVEYRLTADGDWSAWPAGAVTVATVYALTAPVHSLRFTAAVATGHVEVAQ
jgi:hypothetical protein